MVDLPPDFEDLLVELCDAKAEFVLVGGYAVAFHGYPRGTADIDIFVRRDPDNARRVYAALAAFGAPLTHFDVGPDDFVTYDGVLQMGRRIGATEGPRGRVGARTAQGAVGERGLRRVALGSARQTPLQRRPRDASSGESPPRPAR